jgi:hypothetical protein
MSYTNSQSLTAGTPVNITCAVNDTFRITAVNSGGGTGVLVMTVTSPVTGTGAADDAFYVTYIYM